MDAVKNNIELLLKKMDISHNFLRFVEDHVEFIVGQYKTEGKEPPFVPANPRRRCLDLRQKHDIVRQMQNDEPNITTENKLGHWIGIRDRYEDKLQILERFIGENLEKVRIVQNANGTIKGETTEFVSELHNYKSDLKRIDG